MSQISKDCMIDILKPYMKKHGFKKVKGTWSKETDDIIFILNIQGSQWGPEFYINLGVYLRALGSVANPTENLCHIRTRINRDNIPEELLVEDIMNWFKVHGSILELKKLFIEDKLPLTTVVKAKEFFDNIDIDIKKDC